MKVIFSLLISPALYLMATKHSTDVWCGSNDNLFANLESIEPYIIICSVKPAGICFGNGVEGYPHEFITKPSVISKSIEIIEQSFEPSLWINRSKDVLMDLDKIFIMQLLASTNLSLARFGKRNFITAIATETKIFQIPQSTIEIPSEYIFYQWAFFVLIIWAIIVAIIDLIKLAKHE